MKDIVEVGDSIILPGDGASHTEVRFRYIVFRPRIGDIITGKIRSCSRDGVHSTFIDEKKKTHKKKNNNEKCINVRFNLC